uniref:U6 snRNA-associated Sm-like protein LSm4 n=1 Tax=Romanomermis culicivorax TaxID=13658 RepID=A0A915K9W2_ROMCU
MVLPLSLLRTAQNHPMLVELKNCETYNGHLVACDNWMNIHLRDVICTSRDGDKFWRIPEVYVRGSNIKYMRIPDEILDAVKDDGGKELKRSGNRDQSGRGGKRPTRGGAIGGQRPNNRGGGAGRGGFQKKK